MKQQQVQQLPVSKSWITLRKALVVGGVAVGSYILWNMMQQRQLRKKEEEIRLRGKVTPPAPSFIKEA